jgi:hypothetical protein
MDPVKMNTLITYVCNLLYCKLSERDYIKLGVFFSVLSKEMLTMDAMKELCEWEKRHCGG